MSSGTAPIPRGGSPTTSATQTVVGWDTPYTASALQGDSLFALHRLPSGKILTGSLETGVQRVDLDLPGMAVLESNINGVSSFAERSDGQIFLGTSQPFFMGGGLGRVYVRDRAGNWALSLDHPLGGVVVAALGDDVYAFASEFGGGTSATLNLLLGGSSTWQQDVVAAAQCQINKADTWRNKVWVGGSNNTGGGGAVRLFRGGRGSFEEVSGVPDTRTSPDQLESCFALKQVDGRELYLATGIFDTASWDLRAGALYRTRDGATWTRIRTYQLDCPVAVEVHEGKVFVGLQKGGLERLDRVSGRIEPELTLPANRGVVSLLSITTDALLAGARGNSGAELFRRTTRRTPAPR